MDSSEEFVFVETDDKDDFSDLVDLDRVPSMMEGSKRLKFLEEFSCKNWLEDLKELTFETKEIDISFDQLKEIVNHHSSDLDQNQTRNLIENSLILKKLNERIDKAIEELNQNKEENERKVFLRMSTRSPKDASYHNQTTKNLFLNYLSSTSKTPSVNDALKILVQSSKDSLKMNKGEQFMHLLLTSERIWQDFLVMINFGEKKENLTNLYVRKWSDFEIWREFRVFTYFFLLFYFILFFCFLFFYFFIFLFFYF